MQIRLRASSLFYHAAGQRSGDDGGMVIANEASEEEGRHRDQGQRDLNAKHIVDFRLSNEGS